MDFELSDERRMLMETATRFISDSYDLAARHAGTAADDGFSRDIWQQFAELGLIGALLPAEVGGYGGAGEDIAVVFEALGRGLVMEPFLATGILGAHPIVGAGSGAHKAVLDDVIAGNVLLALAHGEPDSRYEIAHVGTTAVRDGAQWRLNGAKSVVMNGDTADKLVVSARVSGAVSDQDGLALFLVDAKTSGLARRGSSTIDGGRVAELSLDDVVVPEDGLLGDPGKAYPLIEDTLARGALALSAEAIGIMDTAKDLTLDYLKTRTQFGRPIGSFQVLQHRMVDVALEIEQARSLVMLAASQLTADRAARERAVSAAKNLVGRVGRLVSEETIQMHGGIAMTWEYALGHYAKRLTMIDHQLGDTDFHLARFIALGGEASP